MSELLTELQTQAKIPLPGQIQSINAKGFMDEAAALVIRGQRELDRAAELRGQAKSWLEELGTIFDKEIAARHMLHKAALALKNYFAAPLETSVEILNRKVVAFDREQQRQREQERIRLENEARKKAEEEAAIAAAKATEAGASKAEIKEIQRQVEIAPPIAAPEPVYRPPTISIRQAWTAEVTNHEDFCRAAVEAGLFNLLTPNQTALNAMAKSQKGYAKLQGVRFFDAGGVAGKKGA